MKREIIREDYRDGDYESIIRSEDLMPRKTLARVAMAGRITSQVKKVWRKKKS